MGRSEFEFVLDGPGVESGELSVAEYAPALIALNDLVVATNAQINGPHVETNLVVRSTPRQGSLIVDLALCAAITVNETDLIGGIVDAGSVLAVIFGEKGLFGVLEWVGALRKKLDVPGTDAASVSVNGDGNTIVVFHGENMIVGEHVARAFSDPPTRLSAAGLGESLASGAVESMRVDVPDGPRHVLTREHANDYAYDAVEVETVRKRRYTATMDLVRPELQKIGSKWEFNYQGRRTWARIEDESFLRDLETRSVNLKFGAIFEVMLRDETTYLGENERPGKPEFFIERVIDINYGSGPPQSLPLSDPTPD